ncbi:MAG: 30S ribosomal protein S1 [Deltaproteobacteria bacterium]|nr:30S ribosomal protein S1 [Deltaproteobacteria bacterium]
MSENLNMSGDTNNTRKEFAQLLEESFKKVELNEGQVVKGTILEITPKAILVDVGFKSEGYLDRTEFGEEAQNLEVGQQIEVYIARIDDESGTVQISKDKAKSLKAWDDISKVCEENSIIEGKVIKKVKGGLTVDIGVQAFLPSSQVDLRPPKNLDPYVGKKFQFKIIKFNKKRGNIVLSRRALLENERDSIKQKVLENIEEGQVVKGVVKNITEYGAFVDLGGIDGLLHVTDMSWGRVEHPGEICKVGDSIDVKVLKYDPDRERVSLGLKQISEDPWEKVEDQFNVGQKVKGKVVSLTNYGAFIELSPGIEGLVHVSEMSWTKKITHPSQTLKLDDEVESIVLDIDPDSRRISLGLKQLEPNPWDILEEKYTPGIKVKCKVKNITDFGIFVGVPDSPVDGLIHVSDLSWTKKMAVPQDLYAKDQEVEAVVLNVDKFHEKFSLGVKQLTQDPWQEASEQYAVGTKVKGTVVKITDFGVFIEFPDGVEALVRSGELVSGKDKDENPKDLLKEGDTLEGKVINLDLTERKIAVSIKALHEEDFDKYLSEQPGSKATLGDIFKKEKKKGKKEK